MRDLTAFNRRLQTTYGADWCAYYDETAGRYAVKSLSVSGREVTQFWCRFHDATTGAPLAPDPITGLHPYRDLDEQAQEEMIRNLDRSYIGSTGYGEVDWMRTLQARRVHNASVFRQKVKQRAQQFADLLSSFDIRRPGWKKETGGRIR